MKKVLKWAAWSGIGLIVLVGTGLALVPVIIDPNDYKPELSSAVQEATGRPLHIDGEMSLALLPSPRVEATGIRYPNIAGGSVGSMLAIRKVEIAIDWLPLLTGVAHIRELRVTEPVLVLERTAAGEANWELQGVPAAQPSTAPPAFSVVLDELVLANGEVRYLDAGSVVAEKIVALEATLKSEDLLSGPYQLLAKGRFHDQPLELTAEVGKIAAERPLTLNVALSTFGAALTAKGELARPTGDAEGRLDVAMRGDNLATSLEALGIGHLPPGIATAFDFSAELNRTKSGFEVTPIAMRLGDAEIKGRLTVTLGEVPDIDLELGANRVDLAHFIPAAEADPEDSDSGPLDIGMPTIYLPQGANAKLKLSLVDYRWQGQTVGDATLSARLANGRLQIDDLSTELPGSVRLAVKGEVGASSGVLQVDATIDGEVSDPKGALAWLKLPTSDIPAEAYRHLALHGAFSVQGSRITGRDISLRLDDSTLSGDLALVLAGRPNASLDLALDRIDADAYLSPFVGRSERREQAAPARGEKFDVTKVLRPLSQFDGSLRLAFGDVIYNRQRIRDGIVSLKLDNGRLDIDEIKVADLAQAALSLKGTVSDLGTTPAVNVEYQLSAKEAAGLVGLLAPEAAARVSKWGRLDIEGQVKGNQERINLENSAKFAGATASLKGQIGLTAGAPVDAELRLDTKDPSRLLQFAGITPPKKLGAFNLRLHAKGNADASVIDGDVALVGGKVALEGSLRGLASEPEYDLALKADLPRLATLLEVAVPGYKAPKQGKIGRIKLTTTLSGSSDVLSISDLVLAIGDNSANGHAWFNLKDRSAEISINAAYLNLDEFIPVIDAASTVSAEPSDGGEIAFKPPTDVSIRLDLGADEVIWRERKVRNGVLKAGLSKGVIAVDRLSALLPGESQLALTMQSVAGDQGGMFAGDLQLTSAKLRELLAWLDAVPAGIDKRRLVELELKSRIEADINGLSATNLALRLDETNLNGGVTFAWTKRPKFAVQLSVDRIDLDSYLASDPENSKKSPKKKKATPTKETAAAPASPLDGLKALAPLAEVDGRVELSMAEAVLHRQDIRQLQLQATIEQGVLTLEKVTVADLAGAEIKARGKISELDRNPTFSLSHEVRASEANALFALAGIIEADSTRRFGVISLSGEASGDASLFALKETGTIAGARLDLDAKIGLAPGAPVAGDIRLEAPEASSLLALAGLPATGDLGPLSVQLTSEGSAEWSAIKVSLEAVGGTVILDGAFATVDAQPSLDAKLTVSHPDLPALLGRVDPALAADAKGLEGPFNLAALLIVNAKGAALSKIASDIAGVKIIDGTLGVPFEESPVYAANIHVDAIDVDALMARFAPPEEKAEANKSENKPPAFSLPEGVRAAANLRANSVKWNGRSLNAVTVKAKLDKGRLEFSNIAAALPGKGRFKGAGVLRAVKNEPQFDGKIEANIGEPRTLLKWLDVALPSLPPDRLQSLIVSSAVTASSAGVALDKLALRVDETSIGGKVRLELRKRPRLNLDVNVDRLVVDAYLPPASQAESKKSSKSPRKSPAGDVNPLAPLAGFDGAFNVTAGEFVIAGQSYKRVQLSAALDKGKLEVSRFEVGDLAGAQLAASGNVQNLAKAPQIDARYNLNAKDLRPLLAMGGGDVASERPIGPFSLDGTAQGDLTDVNWQSQLALGEATAKLDGGISGLGGALRYRLRYEADVPNSVLRQALSGAELPFDADQVGSVASRGMLEGDLNQLQIDGSLSIAAADVALKGNVGLGPTTPVDAVLTISAEDATRLLQLAGLTPPPGLGAMSVRIVAKGTTTNAAVEGNLTLMEASASVAGNLNRLDSQPEYDLAIKLNHPRFYDLIKMVDAAYEPEGGNAIGAIAFSGQVTGGATGLAVTGSRIESGSSKVSGDIRIHLDGVRPRIVADLASERLDLRPLLPRDEPGKGKGKAEKKDKVFSSDPLPLQDLKIVDAEVRLRAKLLLLRRLAFEDTNFALKLADGKLALDPLEARIGDGNLAGFFTLTPLSGQQAEVATDIAIGQLDLGAMLQDLEITDTLDGKLDGKIGLAGRGRSVAEIMAHLNGKTSLVVGKGRIDNKYIDIVGANLAGDLVGLLTPGGSKNYTDLNCMVSRFDVVDGLATSTDLVMDTSRMTVVGNGTVNLKTERLNISLKPSPKKGVGSEVTGKLNFSLGELTRPFKLGGTLANPSMAIDLQASALTIGKAVGGTVLLGPVGLAAALVSTSGPGNPCVKAIEAVKTGVQAPASQPATQDTATPQQQPARQQSPKDEITKPVDQTIKNIEGTLKGLFKR